MNKVHRIIWSSVRHCFVVTCELARSRGKGSQTGSLRTPGGKLRSGAGVQVLRALALVQAMLSGALISPAWAQSPVGLAPAPNQLPTGGKVVAGQATLNQTGANLIVNQTTQRAAIDWNAFNVGSGASVQFVQPGSSSVILNRVLDPNPSQIFGRISANGQVFITNPNGVYFSPGASVDVGGLVATTHQIGLSDFMAGKATFERMGATGTVLNEGQLKASLGGYIALLAPEVRNQGLIVAQLGTVALAAGEAFDLQFDSNNSLASVRVTPLTIAGLVDNRTAVLAPGGLIILSALGVSQLQAGVVNNAGNLEASSLVSRGGRILLQGDKVTLQATSSLSVNADATQPGAVSGSIVLDANAAVQVSGSVQANNDAGMGGQISISGQDISLRSEARLQATGAQGGGTILVGGDLHGAGSMRQATTVTMEAGAVADASATVNGDGGKVVLWSDIHNPNSQTTASGSIRAQGGSQGGNGGQVETSGYRADLAGVQVNASSPQGNAGQWLIDPFSYTIDAAEATTINNALGLGTSVTVDTNISSATGAAVGGAGSLGPYNITINAAIAKSGGGNASLTLNAGDDIVLNAGIASTVGTLTTTMNAGGVISGAGAINTNGGLLTLNAGAAGTLSGVISGTGALTKSGAGTTTLTANNTYSGSTSIAAGTLVRSGTSASVNHDIASGAVLEYNLAGNVDEVTKTYTGAGTLRKTGVGLLVWQGGVGTFNLSSGSLIDVQEGTLQAISFGNDDWSNNKASVNVLPGAVFDADTGANVYINALTGGGSVKVGINGFASILNIGVDNGSGTFSGVLSDKSVPANIVKVGTGTQILTGANTYTGTTTISAGTLQLSGTSASVSHAIASGATLEYNVASGNLDLGSKTYTGLGTLQKTGAGGIAWGTGVGTFSLGSGALIDVQGGTFTGSSNNNEVWAGNLADLNVAAGATFTGVEGDIRVDALTGAGTVKSGFINLPSTISLGVDNGSGTFTGTVVDEAAPGKLIKEGTGSQTLTGNNTFTGSTTVNAGTLVPSGAAASASHSIASGAVLEYSVASGNLDLGAKTYSGAGTLRKTGAGSIVWGPGAATFNLGSGSLIDVQAGTLQAIAYGNDDWSNNKASVNVQSGAVFDADTGANLYIDALTGGGSVKVGFTGFANILNIGVDNSSGTFSGVLSNKNVPANITKLGTGTQILSGANTYTGATVVNAGTLQAGSSTAFGSNSAVTLGNVASTTLDLNGFDVSIGSLSGGGTTGGNVTLGAGTLTAGGDNTSTTFDGVISGTGGVTKAGTGTLTYTNANTYAGVTTINAGGALQLGNGGTGGSRGSGTTLVDNGTLIYNRSANTGSSFSISGTGGITKLGSSTSTLNGNNTYTYTYAGMVNGDTSAVLGNAGAAFDSQNVMGASQITVSGLSIGSIIGNLGSNASDYSLSSNSATVAASITPKALAINGLTASSKTYDGSTRVDITNWGSVETGVGSETLVLNHGSASFADPNAAATKTVNASGFSLSDAGSGANAGVASNYSVPTDRATTADITKASLTVIANNDAKFVTTTDSIGYGGVSYAGFVNGETSAVIGAPPSITRTNTGVETANTGANPAYVGVLEPTGGSAANYAFSYVNGDYTIVPANQLLVTVGNINTTYGAAPTYAVTQAKYLASDHSTIVDLSGGVTVNGSSVVLQDGTGGTAQFSVTPSAAVTSSSGQLSVGSYQLSAAGVSGNSANFSDTITVVGNYNVAKKGVTATTNGASKTYDGTTSTQAVTLALNGKLTGDFLTTNGTGAFDQSGVGSNLGYTISGMTLSGADAIDYVLLGSSSISGSNGVIVPRPLTVTADAKGKTYGDANPALTYTIAPDGVGTSRGLVNGDALNGALGTAATQTSNVGNYVIDASALANANYIVTASNGVLSISPKAVTLTAPIANKVYDGGITYTVGAMELAALSNQLGVDGDSVTASTVHYIDKNFGIGNKGVILDAVTINDGNGGGNFSITRVGNSVSTISKAALNVVANNESKVRDGVPFDGGAGIQSSGFVGGDGFDSLAGQLNYTGSSQGAVNPGSYAIIPFGLSSNNYDIQFVPGNLAITASAPTILIPSGSTSSVSGIGGIAELEAGGAIYSGIGVMSGDIGEEGNAETTVGSANAKGTTNGIQMNLVKEATEVEPGLLIVNVPTQVKTAPGGFVFQLPSQLIRDAAADAIITITTAEGNQLPPWLNFDASTRMFTANNVPVGGLPLRVIVRVGGRTYAVEIVETDGR